MPGYVRACHQKRWHLALWKKGGIHPGDGKVLRVPYRCGSWRHPGRCAIEKSQEDAARIKAALSDKDPRSVLLLVLTFKQQEYEDEFEAYAQMKECWRSFAKAVRRQWGEMGYVATVEKHRSGWPHLNAIAVCEGMAEDMRLMPRYVQQWVKDTADACGFGNQAFVDVARDSNQVAGYVVKLADQLGKVRPEGSEGETVGEVVKTSQLPTNAPKGMRRLRSSKGFLPDLTPESEYTGKLEGFPRPEDMSEGQKELWAQHLDYQEWHRAHHAALASIPAERWREINEETRLAEEAWKARQKYGRVEYHQGPPPEGEEWIGGVLDEDWTGLDKARARPRPPPPTQEELF